MSELHLVTLEIFGGQVDLLPYAAAVAQECPYRHDLSASELATLTVKAQRGKYINVDTQDRVEGRMLHCMIRQVMGRVFFYHLRRDQLLDHAARRFIPNTELLADLEVCPEAAAMTGRFLSGDELKPLPLPSCWGDRCFCSYAAREENAAPGTPMRATFTGGVEIEPAEDEDDER